jgi:hypothetical protein
MQHHLGTSPFNLLEQSLATGMLSLITGGIMKISQQLVAAGFDKVAQSLPFRVERMRSNGIECDEATLLPTIERDEFRSINAGCAWQRWPRTLSSRSTVDW